jgi:hypothetical protein
LATELNSERHQARFAFSEEFWVGANKGAVVRNGEGRNRNDAIKAAGGHGRLEQRLHKIYSATPS